MSPTVEKTERIYWISLRSKTSPIHVRADVICEPSSTEESYRLKREGQVVATFKAEDVTGWWLEDKDVRGEWSEPGSIA